MALRIHFTDDDFGRARGRTGPDPLWELVLSLTALQSRRPAAGPRVWSARVRKQLRREGLLPHPRPAPALELSARAAKALPSGRGTGIGRPAERRQLGPVAGDGVVRVEKTRLRADLQTFFVHGVAPSWVGEVADGARALLGSALTSYGAARETPVRPSAGNRQVAPIRWESPEFSGGPSADRSVYFGGLLVIPAYFRVVEPDPATGPEQPVVLARAEERALEAAPDPLPDLLGEIRARALHALAVPRSTAELAGEIGVTPVAASKHTSVLRRAGLVESQRDGNTVRHAVTATGLALLSASGA
ncbi:ArsR family transcriptional regulator [Amycolatopsis sp. AA4]|uniref:ArsR/SmtB family transcription factor n=1 Tax=Actinomycetes TaxID=1760 RepID=UPI0001B55584|nr:MULTISPECIES: winged helix-turn-helix domain-containing protein [Actinomycetes]ATY11627.1 ArsR family transcriptional regulator [Amycolatopsis sp. AA4]